MADYWRNIKTHTWRTYSGPCYEGEWRVTRLRVHRPELFVFAGVQSLSAADPRVPVNPSWAQTWWKLGRRLSPESALSLVRETKQLM